MNERLGETRLNKQGTTMKIVRYGSFDDIDIEFMDEFHYIKEHQTYSNFKSGGVKNPYDRTICGVGYIGVGEYKTGTDTKHTEEYQNWTCMIRRCYDEKLKERYSAYYGDCFVCEEWHNFQNFAKWWNENIYRVGAERMHLDKDILFDGNRMYSPNTCVISPQRINMLFMKKPNKYNLPNGIKPSSKGRYESKYNGKYLGVFDSIEDAIMAHDMAKSEALIQIANEYKDKIPNNLYEALINWKPNYQKCA